MAGHNRCGLPRSCPGDGTGGGTYDHFYGYFKRRNPFRAQFSQLAEIHQTVSCNIIASGGVSCLNDIDSLRRLGLYGAICGKSLYQGTLDLKQALSIAGEQENGAAYE